MSKIEVVDKLLSVLTFSSLLAVKDRNTDNRIKISSLEIYVKIVLKEEKNNLRQYSKT